MNYFKSAALWAFGLALGILGTSHAWATPPPGYALVWSDEFNGTVGTAPNSANWVYDLGASGWGNSELENYTNSTANAQIVADVNALDGKALAIIALDTNPTSTSYNKVGRYTSARLNTSGKQQFQYGWMEARVQMPYGQGIWPAFWMLGSNIGSVGWPACGETDIMEAVGDAGYQGTNYGSLHAPSYNATTTYVLSGGQLYKNAYHTFSVLWQQDQVQFYVDDVLYQTQTVSDATGSGGTWAFNHPFFFLLNTAVGGTFPGLPNATTSFPQTMLVDYVRAYEMLTPTPTPTATPTASPTPTPTATPGTPTPVLSGPLGLLFFPNPYSAPGGQVHLYLRGQTATSDVKVTLYTQAFRKISWKVFPAVAPGGDMKLDLLDYWGSNLSNGLYFVVAETSAGKVTGKLLILR